MPRRAIRRAFSLGLAASLVASGIALADTIQADGDLVATGAQTVVDLGAVAPGARLQRDVGFTLVCAGLRHADPGQVVTLRPGTTVIPSAGGSISATEASIGPVPGTWADDRGGIVGCPSAMRLEAGVSSTVTIVAPPTPGSDFGFTLFFARSLSPAGASDASSLSGSTVVTFVLDVVDADTTPPALHDLPGPLELVTVDPAGAVLDYALPSATDDRDPTPVVTCDPPPGVVAPVGSSSVTCSAADAAGNTTSATFAVLVHLARVAWEEPVGQGTGLTVRGRRTVPVKAKAWLDGEPISIGAGTFVVRACSNDGARAPAEQVIAAAYEAGAARWMGLLPTAGLGPGCHRVVLVLDGIDVGSFELDLVATAAPRSPMAARPT